MPCCSWYLNSVLVSGPAEKPKFLGQRFYLKELLKKRWGLKGGWIDNPEHYKEAEQPCLFEDFFGGN